VLRPEVAAVIVDMMRSVVEEGTARKARKLRLNIAGKTGTTNESRDTWFIGMTPDLVVGVWVGFDDFSPLGRGESGSRSALPVFVDIMTRLRERTPPIRSKEFSRPAGVVQARIDKATGLLAADGADKEASYDELFIEGTVPAETAAAPGEVDAASVVFDQYDDAAYADDETPSTEGEDTSDDEP
jgi:penicillin-binding protein 1A